ncbi:eCIS core domain-containing protein [Caldilinea sp.]|uniref:eCIS core domain-containing protein n=1 Tax=Caldilinea sp. TaxID=2293560 RepID=UPI002607D94A|nr:DUF4157 domain-containing protein [uncultured Caldilinea sp.]
MRIHTIRPKARIFPSRDGAFALLQKKRLINTPGDRFEQEADHAGRSITQGSAPPISRRLSSISAEGAPSLKAPERAENSSAGRPLPGQVRTFMEARFGHDFSKVRVHDDAHAKQTCRGLHAQAFTRGEHIYFGAGRFPANNALTAHELTHVVQQRIARVQETQPTTIQRVVEVRPPGRGETSAFDRRQELIDRLNTLSSAIQYRLEGREIRYDVIDATALTNFDRQMQGFIDRPEIVPMRLITSAGRVDGAPLLVDSFIAGYVDLDDMLASDDLSFQMNLIHLLTERFRVRNYARRIGTDFSALFDRAHRAGLNAEVEVLRDVFSDPTIRFVYEETRPNGTDVFGFRSAEGYSIFHVFRRAGRARRGGEVFVQTRDGRRLSVQDFLAERAAAPAAP